MEKMKPATSIEMAGCVRNPNLVFQFLIGLSFVLILVGLLGGQASACFQAPPNLCRWSGFILNSVHELKNIPRPIVYFDLG